uniref:Uncharacterized protein n=1 Tax=Molossus molossus TaxID=27622 RepID=A0A7J8BJ22_MOLMO|nr:hypothetical protein HJG59_010447 [Molossus molossus]
MARATPGGSPKATRAPVRRDTELTHSLGRVLQLLWAPNPGSLLCGGDRELPEQQPLDTCPQGDCRVLSTREAWGQKAGPPLLPRPLEGSRGLEGGCRPRAHFQHMGGGGGIPAGARRRVGPVPGHLLSLCSAHVDRADHAGARNRHGQASGCSRGPTPVSSGQVWAERGSPSVLKGGRPEGEQGCPQGGSPQESRREQWGDQPRDPTFIRKSRHKKESKSHRETH